MKKGLLLLVLGVFCTSLQAQTSDPFNGLIDTLYAVISGPKGERDWDKFKGLFHTKGMMGATAIGEDGQRKYFYFTPEQYIERNAPFMRKNDFFEEEIHRKVSLFGGIAQVFTSYQFKLSKESTDVTRGINSIQLVKEKGRWWITSLIWEAESDKLKLPSEMSTSK